MPGIRPPVRRRSLAQSLEGEEDYDSDYMVYDNYDLSENDSHPYNLSVASAVGARSLRPGAVAVENGTKDQADKKLLPNWGFRPMLPSISLNNNTDQRIVGGDEAKPGEIPWQVKLGGGGLRWYTAWGFLLLSSQKVRIPRANT